jgi:hypothetical protein
MKISVNKSFKWFCAGFFSCWFVYQVPAWYWCTYAFIHPDAALRYEEKFANKTDADLIEILNERPSPRTQGASFVWNKRHPAGKPFVAWTNTTQGK